MENKFYNDDFEQLLKEKSDEFRMYPSKRVWHSIYNDLHPSRKWPSMAMSMLLVIALLLIGYLNTGDNVSKKLIAGTNSTQPGSNENNNSTVNSSNSSPKNTASDNSQPGSNILPGSDDNSNAGLAANTLANGTPSSNPAALDKTDDLAVNSNSNSSNQLNNPPSTDQTQPPANNKDVIAAMDNYINSNQLLVEVAARNNKNKNAKTSSQVTDKNNPEQLADNYSAETNKLTAANAVNRTSPLSANVKEDMKTSAKPNDKTAKKNSSPVINPNDEKSWIEDYALHNKSARKKWKDRVLLEFYATPSVGYRKLENIAQAEPTATSLTSAPTPPQISKDVEKAVSHKPSIGLEAGVGISYSFAKKYRLKAGVQLNYTNYGIKADETYHPTLTTLMFNNLNTGYSYLESRASTLSNSSGIRPVTVHNKTYQVSVPVGLAVKLAGNKKIEWFAGASVQPTFVLGGKANLLSSDYQNYVAESSMLRKWNLNTAVETYINYKLGDFTLQVGPQFRYQVLSTYNKKYTIKENLYNAGLKIGLVKGF